MEYSGSFLINLVKGFCVLGLFGVVFALAAFLFSFLFEERKVREERSRFSTSMGNALLIMHTFFEPGKKPQTEQVIWVKKRRTPLERNVEGLSEFWYDKICIRSYKRIEKKKYKRKQP